MGQRDLNIKCPHCGNDKCVIGFEGPLGYDTRVCKRCAEMWSVRLSDDGSK